MRRFISGVARAARTSDITGNREARSAEARVPVLKRADAGPTTPGPSLERQPLLRHALRDQTTASWRVHVECFGEKKIHSPPSASINRKRRLSFAGLAWADVSFVAGIHRPS